MPTASVPNSLTCSVPRRSHSATFNELQDNSGKLTVRHTCSISSVHSFMQGGRMTLDLSLYINLTLQRGVLSGLYDGKFPTMKNAPYNRALLPISAAFDPLLLGLVSHATVEARPPRTQNQPSSQYTFINKYGISISDADSSRSSGSPPL